MLDELGCKWDLLLVGNDNADAVVEFDVEVAGAEFGECYLNVADILDGPRLGML